MYIVKLALADLVDYYADGTKSPDLAFTATLHEGPLRVRDVVSTGIEISVDVVTESGRRDTLYFEDQASEWFTTTDKAVSELG